MTLTNAPRSGFPVSPANTWPLTRAVLGVLRGRFRWKCNHTQHHNQEAEHY